jgi:hypothetical protein
VLIDLGNALSSLGTPRDVGLIGDDHQAQAGTGQFVERLADTG